jgi:hypothetical protein
MILDFLKLHAKPDNKTADEKDQSRQNQDNVNNNHKDSKDNTTAEVVNTEVDKVENTKHDNATKDNDNILEQTLNPKPTENTNLKNKDIAFSEYNLTNLSITPDLVDDLEVDKSENNQSIPSSTNWTITDDLYDELPFDNPEYIAEVDAKSTIETLLSKSNAEIDDLRKYILSKEIKPIAKKDIKVESMQQYFIDENLAYPLTEEICLHIDNIVGDLTSPDIVSKVLEKDKLKLKQIMFKIKQSLEKTEMLHPIIKAISPHVATQLAIKVFTQTYTKYISRRYQKEQELNLNDIKYLLNTTAINIGNLIIETYVYKEILYNDKNKEKIISTSKYKKVKTHERITNAAILKFINEYNKMQDSDKPELLQIVMSYIMLYAKENKILELKKYKDFSIEENQKLLQSTAQILGMYLIHELEKQDVVEITYINLSSEKQNVPHIKIKHNMLNEILTTPLSYNRPKITKIPRPDYLVIEENETQNIITTTKRKSNIFFNPNNNNNIIRTETFDAIIKAYNEVPHIVNECVFKDILELYNKALSIPNNKLDNELIKHFFKATYFIDLEPIIKENNQHDLAILETIIDYGLSFHVADLNKLKSKVINHSSFNNIYNKITAYKFVIKGLLNEANFFSHFAYFYIEKSPTSSGRLFSDVFFLQAQGHKLACSLLDFYPQVELTETMYSEFISIVKEAIPEIKIPSKVGNNLKDYQLHNKNLYLKQLLSLFTFESAEKFKEYTSINILEEKLIWISTHIKKPKEIWIAYNLLERFLDHSFFTTSYQKQDATSSAIQIIGKLQNDPRTCEQSNIIGNKYNDVYTQHAKLLEKDLAQAENMLITKIKPLMEEYKDGTENQKIIYELITQKTAWEIFKKTKVTLSKKINEDLQVLKDLRAFRFPLINVGNLQEPAIDNDAKIVFMIKEYLAAGKLLDLVSKEILINRNITKKLIMTKGYNAGKRTGVDSILEYLVETLQNQGKAFIHTFELRKLCELIYELLEPHISQNLSAVTKFGRIMREFVETQVNNKNIPIKMATPYITWTFAKHNIKTFSRNRIQINNKKTIRFAIFEHGNADLDAMTTAFASVFVHSCDAFVIHDVIHNIEKINAQCRIKGIPEIRYWFNHDCFTVSAQHAVLLQSIVRVSYDKLHILRKLIPELDKLVGDVINILTTSYHFLRN